MDNTKPSNTLPVGRDKGVIFILLDAFRWDYVTQEDAPTIYGLTQKSIYVQKLVSSSGFTQRSAIFTGALPSDHENYTMYIRDPKTSPFKVLRPFVSILRHIRPEHGLLYKIVRKFINQVPKITASWAPPGKIPSHVLPQISVVEDQRPIHHEGTLPLRSIFDEFREAGIDFRYFMAPVSTDKDEAMKDRMCQEIASGGQVFFTQFSDTDGQVHVHGVASEHRRKVVRQTDERVRALVEAMEQRFEDPWIIICGDHGMVDVSVYLDVWGISEKIAKEHGFDHGKDYLIFLDSTLARFWFFDSEVEAKMLSALEKHLNGKGRWMDESYRVARSIPNRPDWYGHHVWRADVRVGIFPDYFHGPDDKYIGMHGYDCFEDSMKGVGIISNRTLSEQILINEGGLESMCATICDLLELSTPDTATGKSFLAYED